MTELRPVSFNKRRQNEEAFSRKDSWRAHVSPMFAVSHTGNIFPVSVVVVVVFAGLVS